MGASPQPLALQPRPRWEQGHKARVLLCKWQAAGSREHGHEGFKLWLCHLVAVWLSQQLALPCLHFRIHQAKES